MKVYSVGQVNNYIKNIITQDYMLKNISIKGEVSNCKYHSLGHIYFSLKDETGVLPAVMFKGNAATGLDFKLQDGQAVIVTGSMSVYERDGKYQLYVRSIKLDGIGKRYEEFERLKMKLYEEGLFDFEIKKPIPKFPKKVGIVSSLNAAGLKDILAIAKERNPYVQLILYHAKVQGEGAADTIVAGIQALDAAGVDTIIIGRGGGSIEDLWAFNEEKVARAIFAANTPIISGAGHEIDMTLADYAADLRMPTPSAACVAALPDVMSTIKQLDGLDRAMKIAMTSRLSLAKAKLEGLSSKLELMSPVYRLEQQNLYLADIYDKMNKAIRSKLDAKRHRLELLTARLDGLSPTAKLVGGFGYIGKAGVGVTSVREVSKGDELSIVLYDGTIQAIVSDKKRS